MDFFEGFNITVLPLIQVCAALVAIVLSISQLTAKSRHMKSASFWRDEIKATRNAKYLQLAREEHLNASAKVYAESTIPSMKMLGIYAVLTLVFLLIFVFSVALKQVMANPERSSDFLKIGFFPVGLLLVAVLAIKDVQDMHIRKKATILAITQGLPPLPRNELVPRQGLAYLGSISFTFGLTSLFLNFALTSPFPLKTDIQNTALEIVTYALALVLIPLGMIIASRRKLKIPHSTNPQPKMRASKIPWLISSRKTKACDLRQSRFRDRVSGKQEQ